MSTIYYEVSAVQTTLSPLTCVCDRRVILTFSSPSQGTVVLKNCDRLHKLKRKQKRKLGDWPWRIYSVACFCLVVCLFVRFPAVVTEKQWNPVAVVARRPRFVSIVSCLFPLATRTNRRVGISFAVWRARGVTGDLLDLRPSRPLTPTSLLLLRLKGDQFSIRLLALAEWGKSPLLRRGGFGRRSFLCSFLLSFLLPVTFLAFSTDLCVLCFESYLLCICLLILSLSVRLPLSL